MSRKNAMNEDFMEVNILGNPAFLLLFVLTRILSQMVIICMKSGMIMAMLLK